MKPFILGTLSTLLFITACNQTLTSGKTEAATSQPLLSQVQAVVDDPTRLESHVERDAGRKPFEVLSLAGIKSGDKVGEIAPGGGYYTALLSRLVGDEGHVHAVDPSLIFEVFPTAKDTFPKFMADDPRTNVTYSVSRIDAFSADEPLDSILMILYYHDTVWTGEDREAMNQAFYDALKPGGTYLIVDHHGKIGASDDITQTLHRMDASPVISEVRKAGFELVENSDMFRNPGDPRDVSVFKPEWRGKTDRFVYLFRKPKE